MSAREIGEGRAKIDRYELLRKLATGGMAEIFLAKQSGLEGFEKVVVLKRILRHLAADEEFVSMFLDEARIAAKLSHPNIVQIYDLGKSDETHYIAMEYVSGRNVQHLMNKCADYEGLLPIEHVCRIMAGVCDGLYYAHSRKDYDGTPLNIVHRDISPQNILVSFAGGVKVVDFGIAKASTQLAQTRAGVLKGKYAYMSPEQVRGQKIDHRSDLFSVGLVMYEMLTGRRAFERESSLKTLKAIVQEKPLNPRELNPEVPMEVVKLLSKALEKNPDRRYKDAQEMQLALEDYLESSPKKSNNVRLSRYMYELFDEELNADGGTMVVQGIGEVIIPTGADPDEEEQEPLVEDEVDQHTLSRALAPEPPKDRTPTPQPEPAADIDEPLFSAEGPSMDDDDDDELFPPTEAVSSSVATADYEDPPAEFDDQDDKTVPAYDVSDYQRDLAARGIGEEVDDAPTAALGLDDIQRMAALADSDDAPTKTAHDAQRLLDKVKELESKSNEVDDEWEPPTQARPMMPSDETAAPAGPPLPPADPVVRPAMNAGPEMSGVQPPMSVSAPVSPMSGSNQTAPVDYMDSAPARPVVPPPNPAIQELTPPTTDRVPAVPASAPVPKIVWGLLAAMAGCIVLTIILVVVLLVSGPGSGGATFRQLTLNAPGAKIEYQGVLYDTPANLLVSPGASLQVVVVKDGKRVSHVVSVPEGATPIAHDMPVP